MAHGARARCPLNIKDEITLTLEEKDCHYSVVTLRLVNLVIHLQLEVIRTWRASVTLPPIHHHVSVSIDNREEGNEHATM